MVYLYSCRDSYWGGCYGYPVSGRKCVNTNGDTSYHLYDHNSGNILSGIMFQLMWFIPLMVRMHVSISSTCSSSATVLSLIWIGVSPSRIGSNLLSEFHSVMHNTLW